MCLSLQCIYYFLSLIIQLNLLCLDKTVACYMTAKETFYIFKYKSKPQTQRARHLLQHSWCNIFLCAAGHDQVQRSSVRGESLFSHHQSFLLHPPVLKPYFHLLVAQVQSVWQLFSFLSIDEFIHHKFILKFSQLWLRVRLPLLSRFHLRRAPLDTWKEQRQKQVLYITSTQSLIK